MAATLELQRIGEQNESSGVPEYTIIHRVCCDHRRSSERHTNHPNEALFLDQPRMFKGDRKDNPLRGKQELTDLKSFLRERPEISFVVQRDYSCGDYHDLITDTSAFERIVDAQVYSQMPSHIRPFLFLLTEDTAPTNPTSEKIHHCSKSFVDAMNHVQNLNVAGVELLDGWNSNNSLIAPYLQFYHTKALLENIRKEIHGPDGQQIQLLLRYLESKVGQEYREADALFQSGFCTREHFDKLFWRGQIVSKEERGQITAFIIRSCSSDGDTVTLGCETWTFNGKFQRESKRLEVSRPTHPGNVSISSLGVIPLQFDDTGLKERLINRGRIFWNCRNGGLVTSVAPRQGFEIRLTNPRYIIDMATYTEIHGDNRAAETQAKESPPQDDLGTEAMSRDEPPAGPFVLMLPPTIPAFRFHDKKWKALSVEHIRPVVNWDHDAFRRLVLNVEKKDLIQSLVKNHLADDGKLSGDLIEGKGNGLVILLHGGPGTGKTLTAESVAELAERPLYRLTCGDIGTVPETVEKSLEWIFYLGTIWKSVVLLDESEVFLEERSQNDLQRNALVSVFLRAMEYYNGILILTSNRVGRFDEAFKSRVQLAVYYPPLNGDDRYQIWENFFSVIEEETKRDESLKVDLKDLQSSVRRLSRHVLNGREIRNAIRTARHLASFRSQPFSSIHLEHTIRISKEFEEYINDTKGQTDAEFAGLMSLRKVSTTETGGF